MDYQLSRFTEFDAIQGVHPIVTNESLDKNRNKISDKDQATQDAIRIFLCENGNVAIVAEIAKSLGVSEPEITSNLIRMLDVAIIGRCYHPIIKCKRNVYGLLDEPSVKPKILTYKDEPEYRERLRGYWRKRMVKEREEAAKKKYPKLDKIVDLRSRKTCQICGNHGEVKRVIIRRSYLRSEDMIGSVCLECVKVENLMQVLLGIAGKEKQS